MKNKFWSIGLLLGNLALNLSILGVKSSQAAEFAINFDQGSGSLSFVESPLKGMGQETISLGDLYNYCTNFTCQESPQFELNYQISFVPNFTYPPEPETIVFPGVLPQSPDNITFEFNSGDLVGIYFGADLGDYGSQRQFEDGTQVYYVGFAGINFEGNQYRTSGLVFTEPYRLINIPIFDESGNIIGYRQELREIPELAESVSLDTSGTIEFETLEPIEAIPEPLTLLGTISAMGFAGVFKRQLKVRQEARGKRQ